MDKAETSSRLVLRGSNPLRWSVSQIQKEKEAFLKQLQVFPHTFQIQDHLPDDKKERPLFGLVWAISVGYRSERTASLEEARARNMAAFLLHGLGRSEEAIQELDTVLELEGQGNNLVTLANKAVILWEQHNLSQAQQQLRTLKAIQDDTESDFEYLVVRAKAELAFTYSRLSHEFHSRALELFREVLPQAREPELWLWKFGHALTWQRTLRADPDSTLINRPDSMIQEQRDLLTELLEIANTCPCRNTKAKACAELAHLLNLVWNVYNTRVEFLRRIKLNREQLGDQAISLDKQDHSVLVKCGRIFRYTRRLDGSRELLEQAVSMRPSSTGYHHLGITYKTLATNAIYKNANSAPRYHRYMQEQHSLRGARNPSERLSDYDTVRHFGRMSLDDDRSPEAGAGATGYSGYTQRGRGFHDGSRPSSGYRGSSNVRPSRLEMPDRPAPETKDYTQIRIIQKIYKSPPMKGVTAFSRDGEFVMETMRCFELAVDISKGQNTRAMYDLALLHRCLGEYEQAKIYLHKMLNYRHNCYPTDEIVVCEQLGLVMNELSKTENDEQTAKEMRNNSKHWLLTALKAASELYAKSLHKQLGEIWRSFSSLLQEMKTCDGEAMKNLKKYHMEKAELFRLIHDHEESLAVLRHFEQLSPEDKDDPEVLAEYIKNFAGMHEYQQVLTYLNLLKGTTQRERVSELLGEDYERQINIMAGRQALLSARPADDSPYSTPSFSNTFKKSFDDVYKAETSMPDTASSEEGNGVNPEGAASTSMKKGNKPVRKPWDVVVLHEEESSEKADSLVRVLRDLCELRATALHSEVQPGMSELKFTKMMEQSQMVLVLVETDEHNDEVLRLLTGLAALYQSTVVLFTDGAEDKIPDVLKSHRKFLCPDRLLHLANSLDPREACTEDVADLVCQLMNFLTDAKK